MTRSSKQQLRVDTELKMKTVQARIQRQELEASSQPCNCIMSLNTEYSNWQGDMVKISTGGNQII